jgi:predicted AlkP superfamily pyrophosphatase or phosphodiesterase
MAFHLLNSDYTQHVQGPQTNPVYTALALADVKVAEVLAALDRAGIRQQTTVILTADHGFAKGAKLVLPNVVLRENKLLTAGPAGVVAAKAQALSAGGAAMIYLTDPATIEADRQKAAELLKATEGVADVIDPTRYAEIGFPSPEKNRQAPDLVVVAKDGYAFADYATGDDVVIEPVLGRHKIGHHGFINTNPKMNAVFVAAGRGVRAGASVGVIENVDVAPTIAKLLRVDLPGAQGKALEAVLAR